MQNDKNYEEKPHQETLGEEIRQNNMRKSKIQPEQKNQKNTSSGMLRSCNSRKVQDQTNC